MDSATKDLYFQKIEEEVYDEDQIVTCNSIAGDLNISIKDTKQLLQEFVKDKRSLKQDDLSITFVISGILKSNNYPCVYLVKENELEEKKELFSKVNSELVYSVQKNKKIDFNVIVLVDKIDGNNVREKALIGSVVSKNCIKRNLKVKKAPPPQPKPVTKEKPSFFTKLPPKTEIKKPETVDKPATVTTKESPKNKNSKQKQKGLANFFNKVPAKTEKDYKSSESSSKVTTVDKNVVNGDNNINENKVKELKKAEEICQDRKNEEVMEIDVDSDQENIKEKKNNSKTKTDKKSTNKRSRKDKNNEQPSKKRKRIVQREDSDSDDMFEKEKDDEEDDIIETSVCEEQPVPSPPVENLNITKNKQRKAVDKTYEDEDGYIVTKTEFVLESASEDEADIIKKPDLPKVLQKKSNDTNGVVKNKETKNKNNSNSSENEISPAKTVKGNKKGNKKAPPTNQPSIMNFFKKK